MSLPSAAAVRVQYPIFGRRTAGFNARQKAITAIYDEVRKLVPTELLRRRPRTPTVISCYDIGRLETTDRLPLADRVICSTRQVKEEVAGVVKLPHEPHVVHLAVPPTYTPGQAPRRRDRILFVGTEQSRKNVEGLFRIFARVARELPVSLMKVGPPTANRPRLAALARELGIDDRVVWRDFVPETELLEMYRTAAVTVVPSFLEGFSMPCLEAMATGCPLVASNLSAIPEVVGSGGVLLDPRDEAAWAETILRVLHDPTYSSDLSRRGIERSRSFSAERSAREVVSIYEEVWADRGRS